MFKEEEPARPRSVMGVAVLAALATLAVACTGGGGDTPSPTRTDRPSPSVSLPSGLPTGSGLSLLTKGSARMDVTGDIESSFVMNSLGGNTIWQPPNGGMALTWIDHMGNAFGVGGQVFKGTKKTATLLVASMAFDQSLFSSTGGECTITIGKARTASMSGSISCKDLSQTGKSVSVTGTFEATASG
jgi:hypothetical protein